MLNLATATVGERVQETLRVVERAERTRSGGEPYVVLTLGNATGQIDTEPIWSNLLDSGWADGAIRGALVQVIGDLTRYTARGFSRRQLKLSAPLRALPRDSQPLDDFIPHVNESSEQLWDRLDKVRHEIRSDPLRAVLALFFDDEPFRLRFERMPASIGGHHSMRGGLLLHVGEVAYIGRTIARAMRAHVDLVVAGALLHDIGKVEAYDVTWDGFVRTPAGFLVEHVVLGSLMLQRRLAEAGQDLCTFAQQLELQHLFCHIMDGSSTGVPSDHSRRKRRFCTRRIRRAPGRRPCRTDWPTMKRFATARLSATQVASGWRKAGLCGVGTVVGSDQLPHGPGTSSP